jgi:hypothetical protein
VYGIIAPYSSLKYRPQGSQRVQWTSTTALGNSVTVRAPFLDMAAIVAEKGTRARPASELNLPRNSSDVAECGRIFALWAAILHRPSNECFRLTDAKQRRVCLRDTPRRNG